MIKCHRTYDIWTTRECDDAYVIIRPAFNEFARHFAYRIHSRRLLSANCKIFREHRSGDVQHEHDINPAGLDLRETFAELRTRQRN